jgi:hypothetical protein
MSSATSIDGRPDVRVEEGRGKAPAAGDGFRPIHFFVLASLVAATGAVVLSRNADPAHLILLSLVIGAAGLASAGLFRMLAPLVSTDPSKFREPLSDRARAATEREKALVLRSLKELEFDRAMGKISERDFEEMAGRLRARAVALMKQLQEEGPGYRALIERDLKARLAAPARTAPAPAAVAGPIADPASCPACSTVNDEDAVFCKRCGSRLR